MVWLPFVWLVTCLLDFRLGLQEVGKPRELSLSGHTVVMMALEWARKLTVVLVILVARSVARLARPGARGGVSAPPSPGGWEALMKLTLGLGGGDRTAAAAHGGVTEATRQRPGLSWSRNSGSSGKAPCSHPVLHSGWAGFLQPPPRWHPKGCECRRCQKWFSWPQTPRKKLRNSADGVFLIFRQFGHCSWLSKFFRQISFLSKLYSEAAWVYPGKLQAAYSAHVLVMEAEQFICSGMNRACLDGRHHPQAERMLGPTHFGIWTLDFLKETLCLQWPCPVLLPGSWNPHLPVLPLGQDTKYFNDVVIMLDLIDKCRNIHPAEPTHSFPSAYRSSLKFAMF